MTDPSRADLAALTLILMFLYAVILALPNDARATGLKALAAVLAGAASLVSAMKK